MVYALAISIAAAVALLALIGLVAFAAQRLAGGDGLRLGGWRWYPSPLGLLLLLPVAGLLLWRIVPALLLIPVMLPLLWRRRGLLTAFRFAWDAGRYGRQRDEPDDTIDGHSRPIDG